MQNDLIGFSLGEVTMVFEGKSIEYIEVLNFVSDWVPDYATLSIKMVDGGEIKILEAGGI